MSRVLYVSVYMADIYIVSTRIQFVVFVHTVAGKWNFGSTRFPCALYVISVHCTDMICVDSINCFVVIAGVVPQHVLTKCIFSFHFIEHTILSTASLGLYSAYVYNLCDITFSTTCILICLNLLFSVLSLNIISM